MIFILHLDFSYSIMSSHLHLDFLFSRILISYPPSWFLILHFDFLSSILIFHPPSWFLILHLVSFSPSWILILHLGFFSSILVSHPPSWFPILYLDFSSSILFFLSSTLISYSPSWFLILHLGFTSSILISLLYIGYWFYSLDSHFYFPSALYPDFVSSIMICHPLSLFLILHLVSYSFLDFSFYILMHLYL